ncbi:MAG: RHS repeat-associated core domain-containing protein, partial [Pseudomonadota bacterium]
MSSYTDWGNTTTQYGNYDSKGNYGYKIEAFGTAQQRRFDYTYDPRFHSKIATITEASVYGAGQKITTYTYDDYGNRTSETIDGYRPDGTPVSRTTAYQYNGPLHQLSQIDGPRTDVVDVTTFDYHPFTAYDPAFPTPYDPDNGRLRRVTGPAGVLRDNILYTATGKIASEMRPNGLKLSYRYYPGNDRLESLTQTDTLTGDASTTRWTYLATGEVESVTRGVGTPEAATVTLRYDDARRLTRIEDGEGNYIEYTLDTEGNQEAVKTYDPFGRLVTSLTQTFDAYNRLDTRIDTIEGMNVTTDYKFQPDGTLDTLTNGKGIVTDYTYDALQRLTHVTQNYNGTDTATANAQSRYDYDAQDHLTRVTDPNGNATTYLYDDLGNLLEQRSPDTGTTTYVYDAAGNRTALTDARNVTVYYHYDALNRLTRIDYPGTAEDVVYTYDTATGCANGHGRLCQVVDASGTTAYSFDAFGNTVATTRTELGKTYTTYYFYDALQRLFRIIYPDSRVVTYTRDTRGLITDVSATVNGTTTPIATARVFQADGQLVSQSFGNGLIETRNYDLQGRLADQALGSLDSRLLDYDANANLTRVQGTAQSGDYLYDPLDRLRQDKITTTTTSTTAFTYDKNGNRTKLGSTVYGYTTGTNQLVAVGSTALTLDVAGNTRTKGTWGYYYNQAGQLDQAYNGTTLRATYTYNHLGQRTRKVAGTTTTVYHYDLAGNLILETSGTATTKVAYVWADAQPLAHIVRSGTTDRLSYLHTDHLNTPRLATDTTQRVIWRWNGRAFGNTTAQNNPDGDTITTTINLRFPGQYYDSETGLNYNYYRYYDPNTGRYTTADPVSVSEHVQKSSTALRGDLASNQS